jgi:hypothetical protein
MGIPSKTSIYAVRSTFPDKWCYCINLYYASSHGEFLNRAWCAAGWRNFVSKNVDRIERVGKHARNQNLAEGCRSPPHSVTVQQFIPCAVPSRLILLLLEPAMGFPDRVPDPEVAVASGELVPAQYLPNLPQFPPCSDDFPEDHAPPLLKEKDSTSLPHNSFLIRKGDQPVPLPKAKRLSRWGRFQLWFNTYRYDPNDNYYWH